MKQKHEFLALGAVASAVGIASAGFYTAVAGSLAAQGDVLSTESLHSAAGSSSSPEEFVTTLTLILLGFIVGAYIALRKKKGLGLFPWK